MIIYICKIHEDSIFTFSFCQVNIKIMNTISKLRYLEDSHIGYSGKEQSALEISGEFFTEIFACLKFFIQLNLNSSM